MSFINWRIEEEDQRRSSEGVPEDRETEDRRAQRAGGLKVVFSLQSSVIFSYVSVAEGP